MKKTSAFVFALSCIMVCVLALSVTMRFASISLGSVPATDSVSMVPSIAWIHTYEGSQSSPAGPVVQTADGGFLLGTATIHSVGNNIELFKVDPSGNLQWSKTYLGKGDFVGKWLIQTIDGGYAFAGQYEGVFWIAKIDVDGNVQWNQSYAGAQYSWVESVTQTSDGGYALAGQTDSTFGPNASSNIGEAGVIWLLKTDSSGDEQWNKTLGDGSVNSIIQTLDGGYALAGAIGGYDGMPDYLLIKTNSSGDKQWTQTYGSQDEDSSFAVVQTPDGGYALGGWMWLRSNGGGWNIAIVKTDALGNLNWTQYYGAGFGWDLIQTSDGGFAISGTKLVKVDGAGNEQWQLNFTDDNHAYSVIQTRDGGYALAGGDSSAWLAKIDLAPTLNSTTQSPSSSLAPSSAPSLTPSPTIPEFPLWIVGSMIILATTSFLTLKRRVRVHNCEVSRYTTRGGNVYVSPESRNA